MATYTRANAWNKGGTFQNADLLWYAKGVGKMQERALDDKHSWWFFGAIHGQYVLPKSVPRPPVPAWKDIPAPPRVPVTPLPDKKVSDRFWDQCQHQTWYFVPWHRGYLMALEAHIRQAVKEMGGPETWALPYWNYFGPGNQYEIPPAFTQQTLPDGTPNPLYVKARYGPDGNGHIFVPTPAGQHDHPQDPSFGDGTVTEDALSDDVYPGGASAIPKGFGGPVSKFSHGGRNSGGLEDNPHNLVHVYVGGTSSVGLMSVPALAALDPIFYLHHANVDRMWAVWNKNAANTNPTDPHWLNGPGAAGRRDFVMPWPDNTDWVYTPEEMTSLAKLNYTYEELPDPPAPGNVLAHRLANLGVTAAAISARHGVAVSENVELVGASPTGLTLAASGLSTSVRLDPGVRSKVSMSLARAAADAVPDRVFLKLENVRGNYDGSVLSVYINLPEGAKPGDHPELLAGSIGLFGLQEASAEEGEHGGQGLDFVFEVTKIVDALHLQRSLDADSLHVSIVPRHALPEHVEVTVGRVSIFRLGQ